MVAAEQSMPNCSGSQSAAKAKPLTDVRYLKTWEVLCQHHHELSTACKAELAIPQLQQGCHSQRPPGGCHPCNCPDPS